MILRIERAFHVHLPPQLIGEAEIVQDLIRALEQAAPAIAETVLAGTPVAALPAVPAASKASTLIDVLEWHAVRPPDRPHLTFLQDEATELGTLSYGELAARARRTACGLIARDVAPGDRVAVMLPTSIEFLLPFSAFCTQAQYRFRSTRQCGCRRSRIICGDKPGSCATPAPAC